MQPKKVFYDISVFLFYFIVKSNIKIIGKVDGRNGIIEEH